MRRERLTLLLLLLGAVAAAAEQRLYRLGPVPAEWRLPASEIPKRPEPKEAPPLLPPQAGQAGKFDRDFSGPVGSPGFGAALGGATPARPSSPPPKPVSEEGTLLLDSSPSSHFRRREDAQGRRDYLYRDGLTFTLEVSEGSPVGVIRQTGQPAPKEAALSILLGGAVPQGMTLRSKGSQKGQEALIWHEGGDPRLILSKRVRDGSTTEARLMAPGGEVPLQIWRVMAWKEGRPLLAVNSSFSSDGFSLLTETLYTLEEVKPSRDPSVQDVFPPGLKILDQRTPLDSGRAEAVYPWKGKLPSIPELRRMDREAEAPLPGFLKGQGAALNGALLLGCVAGLLYLALWLAKRRTA